MYNSITHGRLSEQEVFEQIKLDMLSQPEQEVSDYYWNR